MKLKLNSTQRTLLTVAAISGSLAVVSLIGDIGDEFELYEKVINNHAAALEEHAENIKTLAAKITLGK